MFKLHSVMGRVAIGKLIGFIIGILSILALPAFGFPLFGMFGLGTLMMFIMMGAMIGFVGMVDRHPVFDFKMNWMMRGSVMGFAVMLMYVLLSFASLETVMSSSLISWTGLSSPFWALIDGVVIGLIMSFAETKIAGEGPDLPIQ